MKKSKEFAYCERLKQLRTKKGWSLQEAVMKFAKEDYSITKSGLNGYETIPEQSNGAKNAGRKAPIDFLLKACDVYGVTLDYLCGRSDVDSSTLKQGEIIEVYGLTKKTLENLKELCSTDYTHSKRILLAFNLLIEITNTKPDAQNSQFTCYMGELSQHIINYVIDTHEYILWSENPQKEKIPRPKMSDDEFDIKTYLLTRRFETLMKNIAKDIQNVGRAKKVYGEDELTYQKCRSECDGFDEHMLFERLDKIGTSKQNNEYDVFKDIEII